MSFWRRLTGRISKPLFGRRARWPKLLAWLAWIGLGCTSVAAFAESVTLAYLAPTTNVDGSPLKDLAGYRIFSGCSRSGQYERPVITVGPGVTSHVVDGLPEGVRCYFAAAAFNASGVQSSFSNEASKFLPTRPPGKPSVSVEWREGVMAATLNGTPVAITWAAGANPAGQSITIPGGTTAVYMFWTYYSGTSGGAGLASATLAGANPSQAPHETPTQASGLATAIGVAAWYNPPTGSQTLDLAWDQAPDEGPTTIVVFVTGGDTTAWRDADSAVNSDVGGASALSVTLTTEAGDLVLKADQRFATTAPSLSAGWTNGQTQNNANGESLRVSYISASGATQVANSEDESFSSLLAISIPAAAAGSAVPRANLMLTGVGW